MRDSAFAAAQRDAPACESADDCVVLYLTVECPALVEVRDCGRSVHREVARRYTQMDVNAAICRALAGADEGCSVGPSCVGMSAPACVEGVCVQQPF